MASDHPRALIAVPRQEQGVRSHEPQAACKIAEMRARQAAKIREIGNALVAAEFVALDGQAKALGLSRSTTWTILRGSHKGSGLSAAIINRMLAAPGLPQVVRTKIIEYVNEKATGQYGHSKTQLRKFNAGVLIAGHDRQSAVDRAERSRRRKAG